MGKRQAGLFPSYEKYTQSFNDGDIMLNEEAWLEERLSWYQEKRSFEEGPPSGDWGKGERALHLAEKMCLASGMKHDDGKKKWHALPLALLEPLADVMEAGAKKYAKFNCLEKFDNPDERFYNGMMRHIEACQVDPLARDKETNCYHAAQIAFNTLMRLYHCKKDAEEHDLLDPPLTTL